jgi:23S rRNA (guanosine2251-2'-O)-methyltransferase
VNRKRSNTSLGRMSVDDYRDASKHPVVVVLDNIRSLHNVGSAFRTADAFRIESMMLCGCTGRPPDREIEKTALGATQSVKWEYFADTISAVKTLHENGYKVYAIEQAESSTLLMDFKQREKLALVFGNEVYGVAQEVIDQCDGVIEIPQEGTKHSLNVAVSIGIVLWECFRAVRH